MRTSIRRRSGPAVAATHSGRRMIQGCAGVIVFLLAFAAPLHAQLPATPEARAAAVERGLQPPILVEGRDTGLSSITDRMAELGVPAVSVAVIHDGRIDWARAWGLADVESGREATPETLFQAASMSKPLAALLALVLADEGAVSIDADVNESLRSWKVPANEFTAKQPVTLRGLLSHTAGVTVHGFPGYAPGTEIPTPVQVLEAEPPTNTAPIRVDTEPGTLWRYSGGGYTIAQQMLEDVTGVPYATLLQQRVLEPLGMSSSTSEQPLPARLHERAATAYRSNGSAVRGRFHTYPEMAAAGLWTTPSDYARFALAIQRSLRGEAGTIYGWPGIAHQVITPIALAPATLDEYTGTYHVADVELTVTRDGDRLMLAQDDGEPLELVPTATDTFVYLGGGITVEFERDERGEVVALLAVNTRAERAR